MENTKIVPRKLVRVDIDLVIGVASTFYWNKLLHYCY